MKRSAAQLSLLLAHLIACGGDGDAEGSNDSDLGTKAIAKLDECKVLPAKDARSVDTSIEDAYDACAANCVLSASCDELKEFTCNPSTTSAVFVCAQKCPESPSDGFACADGTKIPHAALCDGADDCPDAEDEENCGMYTCADGEKVIPNDVECDGFADCGDGSDESDCNNVCG